MIKVLFFDAGNVIYREGYRLGIERFEKRYRLPRGSLYAACHDHQYWKDFTLGKITERQYMRRVSTTMFETTGRRINRQKLMLAIRRESRAIPGMVPFLRRLSKTHRLGLISNHPREWQRWLTRRFHLNGLFEVQAVSGTIHIRKPDAGIFRYALKKAGIPASECVYVDDRPERVGGARKLGMHVLPFTSVKQLQKDLAKLFTR